MDQFFPGVGMDKSEVIISPNIRLSLVWLAVARH